jgi:hypothetical protein
VTLRPTDEQQEIIDVFATGRDMVVEAGAGVGKSSTLRLMANNTGRPGKVIYFNRVPAQQAQRTFPNHVKCSTGHSIAWHAMKNEPFMQRLDGPKVTAKTLAEDHLKISSWIKMPNRKPISSWKVASLATQTVTRFCYSADEQIGPQHVPFIEGADMRIVRREVVPWARRVWEDLQQPTGFAEFQPDHYMKIWALGNPVIEADWVAVDESQDTNPCLAHVMRRQDHLQRIFVGDSQQQLYSWRGSVDVMSEFGPKSEVRYLTQSFRFGDAVAEEANRWLDYLDAPIRLRGLPSIDSRLDYVEHPDAILCRTNADVIEQAMEAQARGMDVAVVGGAEGIASFAAAIDDLKRDGKCRHPDLSTFKTWADVQAYVREEEPSGSFATSVRLIERYGTAQVQAVAARCVDERRADFVISTVHKVKGMEWDEVLLDSNLAPDDASDQHDMARPELMLNYVASTRAKHVLDATALEPFHRRRALRRRAAQSGSLAQAASRKELRPLGYASDV